MTKLAKCVRRLSIGLVVAIAFLPRYAVSEEAKKDKAPQIITVPESQSLKGLGFGVGIGLTLDAHRGNRVADAALVNGIVRITEANDAIAGFIFESHYFFPFALHQRGFEDGMPAMGTGPFAAIEVGSTAAGGNGVINAYALGWMVGLRQWELLEHPKGGVFRKFTNLSWNFGVGLRIDPKAKALGDGIFANQPLPAGETAVRTITAPRYGVMFVTSFGF